MATETFSLRIEDVFSIRGRGYVAVGPVLAGEVSVGDRIWLHVKGQAYKLRVLGIEVFQKTLTTARVGEQVGLLLQGVGVEKMDRDAVLAGTERPATQSPLPSTSTHKMRSRQR